MVRRLGGVKAKSSTPSGERRGKKDGTVGTGAFPVSLSGDLLQSETAPVGRFGAVLKVFQIKVMASEVENN